MMSPEELRRRIWGKENEEETPEWVVLTGEVRALVEKLRADTEKAVTRFRSLDDVRDAIAYRERHTPRLRARAEEINALIRRLNHLVPHGRFQLAPLDVDEETRPLARAYFRA